jgi:hypothetical protein
MYRRRGNAKLSVWVKLRPIRRSSCNATGRLKRESASQCAPFAVERNRAPLAKSASSETVNEIDTVSN